MNRKISAALIIAGQIVFLSSMIAFQSVTLRDAKSILLKTVPVDPVSMFRGRYAALRYEINTLPVTLLKDAAPESLKNGQELSVMLKKDGDYWKADAIYRKRPVAKDQIALRGRLKNFYRNIYRLKDLHYSSINLDYGIESFFLNEERAKEVDEANRPVFGWGENEDLKEKRLGELGAEYLRIYKAGIRKPWVDILNKELNAWVSEGILTGEAADRIREKYAAALEKEKAVAQEISSSPSQQRKTVIVEVAVDSKGYGHPVRLFIDGKEYK